MKKNINIKNASIVIPNYNGKKLLKKFLPSILKVIKQNVNLHELIILDDMSTDGSVDFLNKNFPEIQVNILKIQHNLSHAYNLALKIAKNDVIIFLNNDMKINKKFIHHLLKHFSNNKIFAVHPKHLFLDGITIDGGKRQGLIRFGFFEPYGEHENEIDDGQIDYVSKVLTAENGAYDKNKLIEIGGFDPMIQMNFHLIDVCYRAWKNGYEIIFEPNSVIYHKAGMTIDRSFTSKEKCYTRTKTKLIFMWKNFTDLNLIIRHIIFLPLCLIYDIVGNPRIITIKAFFSAIKDFKKIYINRKNQKYYRTDEEVFKILNLPYKFLKLRDKPSCAYSPTGFVAARVPRIIS